jgi:hypothetical protein
MPEFVTLNPAGNQPAGGDLTGTFPNLLLSDKYNWPTLSMDSQLPLDATIVAYNPSTSVAYTNATASWTQLDSTNLQLTFVCPPSGKVLLEMAAEASSTSGSIFYWAVQESGATVADSVQYVNSVNASRRASYSAVISHDGSGTALVPGKVYTLTWVGRSDGSNTVTARWGLSSNDGPALMRLTPMSGRLIQSSKPTVTIADGGSNNPAWLQRDGTLLGSFGSTILNTSADSGVTWSGTLHVFPYPIKGIRELDNGEILVATSPGGGAPGGLYLSTGWPANHATATWTLVLTCQGGVSSFIHGGWGMSNHDSIVVVSEYGNQAPTDKARYVYLSKDYGATWTTIFDIGIVTGVHVHGSAYDPWWGAIWVVNGDGSAGHTTRISYDLGQTWSIVSTVHQFTAIRPLPNCILFATDEGSPNGVWRIPRVTRANPVLELAYTLDASASQLYVATLMFRSRWTNDPPTLLSWIASGGTAEPGHLTVTQDGYTFRNMWTDTITYTIQGLRTMFGPTPAGTYAGALDDGRQSNYSRLVLTP